MRFSFLRTPPCPDAMRPDVRPAGAMRPGWRRIALAMPALLLGLGLVAVTSSQASAATGCSATYTTQSQWSGGFVANVTVANTGTSAMTGWTVTFTFGGDQKVTNSWNTSLTQSSENVTASNVSYNGAVAAGASASFGFQGTYSSSDAAPVTLTCTPVGSTVSPSVVASPASLSVPQSSTASVGISLSAAPASNVTVTVSRTSGNSGCRSAPAAR